MPDHDLIEPPVPGTGGLSGPVGPLGDGHCRGTGQDRSEAAGGLTRAKATGGEAICREAAGAVSEAWYVYKAQAGREALAEQHLVNQAFKVFSPKLKVTRRTGGRLTDAIRPLFSGYGFVAFDGSARRWRSINGTRGVSYLICSSDRPLPVPADFMDGLIRLSGEGGVIAMNNAQLCERLKQRYSFHAPFQAGRHGRTGQRSVCRPGGRARSDECIGQDKSFAVGAQWRPCRRDACRQRHTVELKPVSLERGS